MFDFMCYDVYTVMLHYDDRYGFMTKNGNSLLQTHTPRPAVLANFLLCYIENQDLMAITDP
jgi:hypothetical protein